MRVLLSVFRRGDRTVNGLALCAVPRWASRTFVLPEAADRFHFEHRFTKCLLDAIGGVLTPRTSRFKDAVSVFGVPFHLTQHRENFCRVQRLRLRVAGLVGGFMSAVLTCFADLIPRD